MEISEKTKERIEQVVFDAFAEVVRSQTAAYLHASHLHNLLAIESASKCPQRSEQLAVKWRAAGDAQGIRHLGTCDTIEECRREASHREGFYPMPVVTINGKEMTLAQALELQLVRVVTN